MFHVCGNIFEEFICIDLSLLPEFDRLHNYGISVHLLQAENQELSLLPPVDKEINSRDDHLSFQVWN